MVRRSSSRDGSQCDGRDNSYGHDSSSSYGDDSATRYISRDERCRGYNPDADFAGEQPTEYFSDDSSETQFLQRGDETRFENSRGAGAQGAGAQDNGQCQASLSEEERGYGQASQQSDATQQYAAGGTSGYGDMNNGNYRGDNRGNSDNDDSKKGRGKPATIMAIAAMVAAVALVALVLSSTSGTEDKNDSAAESTQETSSSLIPTTASSRETTTNPTDHLGPSGTINDTREHIEQELDQLRKSPSAAPGPSERSSSWGTIPQGVMGKSPTSVKMGLRTNSYQNVAVVDAEGNQTNSVAAIMGKVVSIDPPEGRMAETSVPVTIYLQ